MTGDAETLSRRVTIANQRGLHARASAKFVEMVQQYAPDTQVRVAKDGNEAAGGSILGLMMLGAARGDEIEIRTRGERADDALDALCTLVDDRFGED
ncbi:HPr family phosphocarrier protein [uncultured Croceicoccus sp.]|uniref:HPr family phosphocarrier protein n=1 Tax=uncultured Croceicoccus sp. TaxID=1295329 RepID=UPI002601F626|nr:HPr family phosphocarrier protein [uncultured Croceicoccus sp.]